MLCFIFRGFKSKLLQSPDWKEYCLCSLLFSLWKSLSKIVSVSKCHNGLRDVCAYWRKPNQLNCFFSGQGAGCCLCSQPWQCLPLPNFFVPLLPFPRLPSYFSRDLGLLLLGQQQQLLVLSCNSSISVTRDWKGKDSLSQQQSTSCHYNP